MTFQEWAAAVKASGGAAVVWPFKDPTYGKYYGQPAARYSAAAYVAAGNARQFDTTLPQEATANNAWFYVLAPADVRADAPATMTPWQKFQNWTFTTGDKAATAIGLPSLAGLEHVITTIAIVGAIGIGLWALPRVTGFVEVVDRTRRTSGGGD